MFALVRKQFSALRAANSDAEELIRKLKDGMDYTIELKRTRNLGWHRKYWLLCSIIAENLPEPTKKEAVSDYIKMESGHVRVVRVNGELREYPDSISFSSMNAEGWESFWERAVEVCCTKIIPGLDKEELELELYELLR